MSKRLFHFFPQPHALQRSPVYINLLGFCAFSNAHVASDHKSVSGMRYAAQLSHVITIVSALTYTTWLNPFLSLLHYILGFELAIG